MTQRTHVKIRLSDDESIILKLSEIAMVLESWDGEKGVACRLIFASGSNHKSSCDMESIWEQINGDGK